MKRFMLIVAAISLIMMLAATASAEAYSPDSLPSLKDFYEDYFDFGSALSGMELRNTDRQPFYVSQYSIITPENELKAENVLDVYSSRKASTEDQGNVSLYFHAVKPMLDFAVEHGLKVHGHVLFWHSQTPDAFFRESYTNSKPYVSRDVMIKRMENYVRITMEYMKDNYPGLIVSWDVVNEAIDDITGKLRESNFTRIVGDDFVLQAFRYARQYAPEGTLLFYNDYSTPYQPKLDGILNLLDDLNAESLVDGHGLQCHYQLTTPTTAQINLAIQKIVDKGLTIRVSELDIMVDNNTEAQFQLQAKRYKDIMEILLKHSNHVVAVQTWGTSDSLSWKSGNYPLLFNGNGIPKPAFYALTDLSILP